MKTLLFTLSIIISLFIINISEASIVGIRTPRFSMNLQIPVPPTPYRIAQPTPLYPAPRYNVVPPIPYYPRYYKYQKPFEWYTPPRPRSYFYLSTYGSGIYWQYPIR